MQSKKSIYDVEMPVIVPGTYGDVEIEYDEEIGHYNLLHKGISWMGTDKDFISAKDLMHSQYDQAYGDVLLTGLGFGILAKAVAQKEGVNSVTVLELNKDVIDAYLAHNQLDHNMRIIQADASTYTTDKKYDCLLPDHYELQTLKWVLKDMREIAKRVPHDTYWPWSIEEIFLMKTYSREAHPAAWEEILATYKHEIRDKWDEFIVESMDGHHTLLGVSDEKLIEYLGKQAHHYYDMKLNRTDWGF